MSSSSLTTTTTSSNMEAESVEYFDTSLSLGIGCSPPAPPRPVVLFGELFPPAAPPRQKTDQSPATAAASAGSNTTTGKRDQRGETAATTRHSNKKARTVTHGDDDGDRRSPSGGGGGGDDEGASRKKLRLSREQATLLEESFSAHNILSHAQKHELAGKLGLSARQVEVWFQNRRARTKLKQTEADCDLLRRWCERLADENARLRHDLADLRSSSSYSSPFFSSLAAAVCPSCAGAGDKRRQ